MKSKKLKAAEELGLAAGCDPIYPLKNLTVELVAAGLRAARDRMTGPLMQLALTLTN